MLWEKKSRARQIRQWGMPEAIRDRVIRPGPLEKADLGVGH